MANGDAMSASSGVRIERDGGVVTITLARPEKKNAVDSSGWAALLDVLSAIARRPEDRVVVFTGAGDDFCSGADLTEVAAFEEEPLGRMRWIGRSALALHRLPQPTIAKVRGIAAGAGFNMALGCDFVVAGESARFSQVFIRRGLSVDFGGTWLLPRIVGLQRAKLLSLLGDFVDARSALEMGLVAEVVSDERLNAVVEDLAVRLAALPPVQLSLTKAMLNDAFTASFDEALEHEARSQAVSLATTDAAEAVRAFREKREPRFVGR